MADVVPTPVRQRMQMAGVVAGVVVACNVLFWITSSFYFKDKPLEVAAIGRVRVTFATMSLIVAVMAYAAALTPRLIGHGLAAAMGVMSLVGGFAALGRGLPPAMGVTLLVVGGLVPWLVWKSLRYSRSGWSFLIAIVLVFAAVCFFGAPKIRHLLGAGLWTVMIIPCLQVVCVIALSMLRSEYQRA